MRTLSRLCALGATLSVCSGLLLFQPVGARAEAGGTGGGKVDPPKVQRLQRAMGTQNRIKPMKPARFFRATNIQTTKA